MPGRTVDEYRAPLFLAWQLTNRCSARCLACCEESGPDKAWRDELRADEARALARRVVDFGIPYVAFGGGEPLGAEHCWDLFEILSEGGASLKIETDGSRIDDAAADRIAALNVDCVQISVDGASAATHERVRPGSSFDQAVAAIRRLAARGCAPQFVFVPTRLNIADIGPAFDLAESLGCSAFVTGPLMRIGRAAADWHALGLSDAEWTRATATLHDRATRAKGIALSIYPWDILTELQTRLESPQAMPWRSLKFSTSHCAAGTRPRSSSIQRAEISRNAARRHDRAFQHGFHGGQLRGRALFQCEPSVLQPFDVHP